MVLDVRLKKTGPSGLAPRHREAVRRIYQEAFPAPERDDFDVTQREGRLALQLTALLGDNVVGFAQTISIPSSQWCLLEYMAVDREHRSGGIGSMLLGKVTDESREAGCVGLLLEVEHPSSAPDEATAHRRIDFYKRSGAVEVPGVDRYFIPDFTDTAQRLQMKLLAIPVKENLPRDREGIVELLSALYRAAFGLELSRQHLPDLLAGVRELG